MNWILFGVSILALLLGILAYTQRWRGWVRPVPPGHYGYSVGFGLLFFGLAGLALGTARALLDAGWREAAFVAGALSVIALGIFVVSLFWMPRVLLPRWFHTVKGL
ncbi:hypothetical protein [Glaciibacter psychrotolerans]|uniref:Kef-type K+ transport system membrane component KefB n=1 Tax=Glaciibacter psychrotolerans TaxID=670054 RepID=A0A7Z0J795_9MICO|nr:hypothetical protein [Leifsonia psychrotolerans]NYJ20704.1 Kef-type K+ transport system membrane component KefB [Leifsonia psychrotolerans]